MSSGDCPSFQDTPGLDILLKVAVSPTQHPPPPELGPGPLHGHPAGLLFSLLCLPLDSFPFFCYHIRAFSSLFPNPFPPPNSLFQIKAQWGLNHDIEFTTLRVTWGWSPDDVVGFRSHLGTVWLCGPHWFF